MTSTLTRSGARRWRTLVVLCLVQFLLVMDDTVVNVALASIRAELGFSTANLAWVANAYFLASDRTGIDSVELPRRTGGNGFGGDRQRRWRRHCLVEVFTAKLLAAAGRSAPTCVRHRAGQWVRRSDMYQSHETTGHQGSDYPTQELTYPGQRTNRSWLVIGGVSVAALLLLLFAVVACRGGDAGGPSAAVGAGPGASPTSSAAAAASATPAAPADAGDSGGGADPGGGSPGNSGGGASHGNPGNSGSPEDPEPAPLQVTASVAGPPPNPGCAANGTYTLTGGEYPVEVVYMWVRVQSPGGGQPAVPLPFGGQQTTLVETPGSRSVQSPDFPADAGQNQVQLRVLAPQAAASGLVTYPACTELGLSN